MASPAAITRPNETPSNDTQPARSRSGAARVDQADGSSPATASSGVCTPPSIDAPTATRPSAVGVRSLRAPVAGSPVVATMTSRSPLGRHTTGRDSPRASSARPTTTSPAGPSSTAARARVSRPALVSMPSGTQPVGARRQATGRSRPPARPRPMITSPSPSPSPSTRWAVASSTPSGVGSSVRSQRPPPSPDDHSAAVAPVWRSRRPTTDHREPATRTPTAPDRSVPPVGSWTSRSPARSPAPSPGPSTDTAARSVRARPSSREPTTSQRPSPSDVASSMASCGEPSANSSAGSRWNRGPGSIVAVTASPAPGRSPPPAALSRPASSPPAWSPPDRWPGSASSWPSSSSWPSWPAAGWPAVGWSSGASSSPEGPQPAATRTPATRPAISRARVAGLVIARREAIPPPTVDDARWRSRAPGRARRVAA